MHGHARSALHTLTTVLARLESIGGELPPDLRRTFEAHTAAAERLRALPDGADLPAAVLAAVTAGRDPATDPRVQQAALRRQVASLREAISHDLGAEVVAVVTANTDAIIDAFRGPFDAAAAKLTTAADVLGAVDIDDTAAVLRRGPAAAEAWAQAQQATVVINETVHAWTSLSTDMVRGTRLLIVADVPPATWLDDNLGQTGDKLTPLDVARRGYPFSLATVGEHRRRAAALRDEAARRDAVAEQRRHDAVGAPWRFKHPASA